MLTDGTRAKAWLFYVELAGWLLTPTLLVAGLPVGAVASAAVALSAFLAGRRLSRRAPAPMPYSMAWVLRLPRFAHEPARIIRTLQPQPGERVLEVGPGIGVHALPVAAALGPAGTLDVLDIQQEMLDEVARRAARRGIRTIVPARGDARLLPYPASTFDAAYLVTVLGEVPDPAAALRELRRVLKPEGRLLIAEELLDPDFIPLGRLRHMAAAAGFTVEQTAGPRFSYRAVLRPARLGAIR